MSDMSAGQIVGGIVGAVIGFYALGGPMGAAKGFALGAGIGGYVDPPPGPNLRGPTLDDKSFQSSAYGVTLPRIYGSFATMGNIIYLENNEYKAVVKKEEQGGKGGGSTSVTTTKYLATFAIALSTDNPLSNVRRIWAGGKLIYNAGVNDFGSIMQSNGGMQESVVGLGGSTNNGWAYYDGTQTEPDSRMESVLGVGNCPSYEGTAYIIFYDFDLTDYGNGLAGCPIKVEITNVADAVLSDDIAVFDRTMPDDIDQIVVNFNCPCSTQLEMTAQAWGIQFSEPYNKGASLVVDVVDGATTLTSKTDFKAFSFSKVYGVSGFGCWYGYVKVEDEPLDMRHYVTNDRSLVKSEDITGSDDIRIQHVFAYSGIRFYIGVQDTDCYFYIRDELQGQMSDGPLTDLIAIGYPNFCYVDKTAGAGVSTRLRIFSIEGDLVKTFYIEFDDAINSRSGGVIVGEILYIAVFVTSAPAGSVSGAKIIKINILDEELIGIDHINWTQYPAEAVSPHCSFFYHLGVFYIGYVTGSDLTTCRMVRFFYYLDSPMDAGGLQLKDIVESELAISGLDASMYDVANLDDHVIGYRVSDFGSARGALSPLQVAYMFDFVEDGYLLKAKKRGAESDEIIPYHLLGATNSGPVSAIVSRDYESSIRLPSRYGISYIDFKREYEPSTEYAPYPSKDVNERNEQISVVMSADHAAKIADMLINVAWVERSPYKFSLPQIYLHVRPGDVKTVELRPGIFVELLLKEVAVSQDQIIDIVAVPTEASAYQSGALGSDIDAPDGVIPFVGRSFGVLMDIPVIDTFMDTPGFVAAVYGQGSGWPGGVLTRSADNGQTYTQIQAFASAGTIALANSVIAADGGKYIDRESTLELSILSGNFYAVTEEQMMTGMHYCAYGVDGRWEILQYANAEFLGNGLFSLSIFVRGLRGTEWATGLHQQNDFFVLLDDPDNAFIGMDLARLNAPLQYKSVTIGQSIVNAAASNFTYRGVNLEPLSVVNIVAVFSGGDILVEWEPRTRLSGSQWLTGVPAPIGEATKKYEIDVYDADENVIATHTVIDVDAWTYTAAQIAEDFGVLPGIIDFDIYQISATVGRGYAASFSVTIPLWDPSLLTIPPQVWLDDTTAVTVATGVSQWNDRSGGDHHFTQTTSGSQPAVISAAINGKRAIRFDGTDDVLFNNDTVTRDIMKNASGGWVFVVFRRVAVDVGGVVRCLFATMHGGSVADRFTIIDGEGVVANKLSFRAKRSDADSLSILLDGSSVDTYQMLLCNLDYPSQTGEIFVNGDSVAVSAAFTSAGSTSSNTTSPYPLAIGAQPQAAGANPAAAVAYHNMDLAALLHGHTALASGDIDKIFGWAAHNYALQDLLPSDHPYKTNPPV